MNGTVKFLIGAAVTSLMAMASHSALGLGNDFIQTLEGRARAALGDAEGGNTQLSFITDPALQRVAILSGDADAATRERLLAAVRAVPGVADARWADDAGAATAAAPAEAPATQAEVANCQAQVNTAISGQTVQFDTGQATIKPESNALLDAVAAALAPCDGVVVEVAGHTDPSGAAASNQALSEARAQSVQAALVERQVPAARLTARGYGSSQPKVEGRGAAADAANRRIEFSVAANTGAAAAPAATEEGE